MAEPVSAVLVGGRDGIADHLAASLGGTLLRVAPTQLDGPLAGRPGPRGVTWIHVVPAASPAACEHDPLAETRLLRASVEAALAFGAAPLTFLAVLPAPGMFTRAVGTACDLALATMSSLMRDDIATWSSQGRRIAGVVHAGIEHYAAVGQRPPDQLRARTPLTTLGTFGALAGVIGFLASRRASYVTGALVRMDGGWDAYSWVFPARTV